MHTEVLIIGQGISGTLLSAALLRAGKSVLVIDKATDHKTSLIASAVINPLIGKNWTVARDAATLIPEAIDAYKVLEQELDASFLYEKSLLVFPRNKQDETIFLRQIEAQNPYTTLLAAAETMQWNLQWAGDPIGKIAPVYTVDAALLLQQWRQYLENRSAFREEHFDNDKLLLQAGKLKYKDIHADKIVFCEGAAGKNNAFFPHYPFTTNRGDALLLSIPGLATNALYQKGIRLVPRSDGLFWCGSNYTWTYSDLQADLRWQKETMVQLESWLKLPVTLVQHLVAERPTTAGQVPLLVQHSEWPQLFYFNGLGTRGFSAGPQLARQMAGFIVQ